VNKYNLTLSSSAFWTVLNLFAGDCQDGRRTTRSTII
jgi:hypothetical protein